MVERKASKCSIAVHIHRPKEHGPIDAQEISLIVADFEAILKEMAAAEAEPQDKKE